MGEIASSDARALFTKTLIDVYQQRLRPTDFLRSFFEVEVCPTKEIAIEVERQGEFVAVDVFRGTEGNRNSFSLSTEKIFVPPLYKEYFDATQLDLYDRVLGSQGNAQVPLFAALMNKVADRLGSLQNKIERAIELQCAQILFNGQVLITSAVSGNGMIDYRRKTASQVDLTNSTGYWATGSNDPFQALQNGCNFLRQTGKAAGDVFNVILGDQALHDLISNTTFTTRQNLFHMALDSVYPPTREATGAAYHGTVTAGPYKVQLWSYPQYYDIAVAGSAPTTGNAYINTKYAYMIPVKPKFKIAHAAVPSLIAEPGQLPAQGAYVVREFIDTRATSHVFEIQTAALAIPVAVDQIYSMKVVA